MQIVNFSGDSRDQMVHTASSSLPVNVLENESHQYVKEGKTPRTIAAVLRLSLTICDFLLMTRGTPLAGRKKGFYGIIGGRAQNVIELLRSGLGRAGRSENEGSGRVVSMPCLSPPRNEGARGTYACEDRGRPRPYKRSVPIILQTSSEPFLHPARRYASGISASTAAARRTRRSIEPSAIARYMAETSHLRKMK